jgi:small subunit ribosomal protein S1
MDQIDALNGQEALAEDSQPTEVEKRQANQTERQSSMEDLLEEEGLGLDFPKQGEIRTGVIAEKKENEILVSIGTKSEGVIPARERDMMDHDAWDSLEIGQEIVVYVLNPEDPNGNVQLSYVRAMEERDWQEAESLLASSETYEAKIVGFNKGGLIVPLGQLRGFVPASQVSALRRVDAAGSTPEQRWGSMVGELIQVTVIEVDRERRRLIMSERSALQETRETLKERLLDELSEGDVREGRVTSLADFGAFVNIDGADGLVHLSEISWERIQHPRESLRVGQEVKVKVIGVDRERKRIGLSIRQLQDDPWSKKVEHIKEGQLVEGTITHLTKFGAFARLGEDLEGLIHISELSEQRVAHPKEVIHEGEVLTLRVIKIEPERHRIGLSLKKVDSPKYADLDWKTTLAEVVEETHEEEDAGTGVRLVQSEVEAEEVEIEPAEEEASAEPEATIEQVQEAEEVEIEPAEEEASAEPEATIEQAQENEEVGFETGEEEVVAAEPQASVEPEPEDIEAGTQESESETQEGEVENLSPE